MVNSTPPWVSVKSSQTSTNLSISESWTGQASEQSQAALTRSHHRTVIHPVQCKCLRQQAGRCQLGQQGLLQAGSAQWGKKRGGSSQTASLTCSCSHQFLSSVFKIRLTNLWNKYKALWMDYAEKLQLQLQNQYCTTPCVGISGSGSKTSCFLFLSSSKSPSYI